MDARLHADGPRPSVVSDRRHRRRGIQRQSGRRGQKVPLVEPLEDCELDLIRRIVVPALRVERLYVGRRDVQDLVAIGGEGRLREEDDRE